MGYRLHDRCYDTLYDFHVAFAQECSKIGGQGVSAYFYACTASETDVTIQGINATTGATYTPFTHVPQAVSCDISLLNQTQFMWELALILVAGFSVRAIIKAFQ